MHLSRYLARLGYGTRAEVERDIVAGVVRDADGRRVDPAAACPGRIAHADVRYHDAPLDPPPGAVVMVHKPVGTVCSTQEEGATLVYNLLPPRFRYRDPVMATVGRLDRETSGLLLLTDDGALNHRLTSPRSHVPKTYRATLDAPVGAECIDVFASGTLMLRGEDTPVAAATLTIPTDSDDPCTVRITVHEGRYHQVRRMFAAVGRHVVSLHRETIGPLDLGTIPAGTWRTLTDAEVTTLRQSAKRAG